jgi:hypothetical protein
LRIAELSGAEQPDQSEIQNLKSKIQNATAQLRRLSQPFLNWAGKAERHEFTVPTLPLFVHERLSTKAILESVKSHKRDKQMALSLFADEEMDITDRYLKAYEHKAPWVNRLILGDSLVVMNSHLRYEGLGGQVQMIYVDPPYGVKFGSHFQPFRAGANLMMGIPIGDEKKSVNKVQFTLTTMGHPGAQEVNNAQQEE